MCKTMVRSSKLLCVGIIAKICSFKRARRFVKDLIEANDIHFCGLVLAIKNMDVLILLFFSRLPPLDGTYF